MGRKSILGSFLRDMERASARSAADARRRGHRVEAMQSRAFEREMIRQERDAERDSKRKIEEVEAKAHEEIREGWARFMPRLRDYRMAQLAGAFVSLLGFGMRFAEMESAHSAALPCLGLGLGVVAIAQLLCAQARTRQYAEYMRGIEQGAHERRRLALEALAQHDEERNRAALVKATAEHETAIATARERFIQDEAQRLDAIRELRNGQPARIREVLDGLFPLELIIPCKVKIQASSAATVALDLDIPEPTVLPSNEAKLLANGKISYKDKPEKRLREQYLRLVTGSALRHASEVMLNIPTCQAVELHVWRTMQDPSVGNMKRSRVLEATFDYAKLASMSMDAIDPSAALKHFKHRINLDRGKDIRPLDEAEA